MPRIMAAQNPPSPWVAFAGSKGPRSIPCGWPTLAQSMVADSASTTPVSINIRRMVVLMDALAPRMQTQATNPDCRNRPITKAAMSGTGICAQFNRSRKNRPNSSGTVIAEMTKYVIITSPAINPTVGLTVDHSQVAAAPAEGA